MSKQVVRVRREGVSSFSVGGVEYRAGRDGSIEIPVEAMPGAIELGLAPVVREPRRAKVDDDEVEKSEGAEA